MDTDPSKIIVTSGGNESVAHAYHRDFPEIRAAGTSAREAAELLVHQLQRALDSALTDWRRDCVNEAIADARAFVEQAKPS